MLKNLKKALCLLLTATLLIPTFIFASAKGNETQNDIYTASSVEEALAIVSEESNSDNNEVSHDCLTECKGNCSYSPVIIVPGIMQSQVYVQNKDNTGDLLTVDGFPIVEGMDMAFMFDTKAVTEELKKMIWPLIKSLLLGRRSDLIDLVCEILDKCFYSHYFNEDGTRAYEAQVDEYWYSLEVSKTKPEKSYNYAKGYKKDKDGNTLPTTKYVNEFDFIMRQVDISSYADKAGYDHTYYYAYSSFGDTYEIASRFNDFIQMVKDQTGHEKVSIVFISLGGTIGNTYLSEFCNPEDIDRIVFAAAAVDGSYLLSDLMNANFNFDDSYVLYNTALPALMSIVGSESVWLGYLLNIVIRILPQRLFSDFVTNVLTEAITRVLGNLLYNCPSMWALVPSEEYEEMADRLIKNDVLRAKTDRYYNIQKNAAKTMQKLTAEGMDIFVVCGYNMAMPSIFDSFIYSSDNIIHTESTSVGATVAPYGEKLPDNYVPAIDDTYISPYNEIDAGTAALPDRTWFVRGQSHLTLQSSVNDVIELCVQLAIDKNITDARVNNGGYVQFNNYRDLRELESLMSTYEKLTQEQIDNAGKPEKVEELKAAYENAKEVYAKRAWDPEESLEAEKRLYKALYNLKLLGKNAKTPYSKYEIIPNVEKFLIKLSDLTTSVFGSKDFVPFI